MDIAWTEPSDEDEEPQHLSILDVLEVPYHERAFIDSDAIPTHSVSSSAQKPAAKRAKGNDLSIEQGRRTSNRPPLPVDSSGRTILPARLGNSVIRALGHVVHDRLRYHSERYIFPVGFECTREALSVKNPGKKTIWTSRILDGGESPLFRVFAADDPETIYSATSSSGAWSLIIKATVDTGRITNVVSGPDMYGLSNRSVTKSIQLLPGAELCQNYVRLE